MKYALFVVGPAGSKTAVAVNGRTMRSGKSTLCAALVQHCDSIKRKAICVNLDPAAERFTYPVSVDVRDLVTLEDAMKEEGLEEIDDWLLPEINNATLDEDLLLLDCPGQIELTTHNGTLRTVSDSLKQSGYTVGALYVLDVHFVGDVAKFVSGAMATLSAMMQLELPHISVFTKVDQIKNKPERRRLELLFTQPDARLLVDELANSLPEKFRNLNYSLASLIDDWNMVSYQLLDITDEDSLHALLYQIDNALQVGEEKEPDDSKFPDEGGAVDEEEYM